VSYLLQCTQQVALEVLCRYKAIILFGMVREQNIIVWEHLSSWKQKELSDPKKELELDGT
jgi:hypothetical protein